MVLFWYLMAKSRLVCSDEYFPFLSSGGAAQNPTKIQEFLTGEFHEMGHYENSRNGLSDLFPIKFFINLDILIPNSSS
jgi:hypothetical protein